MDAKTARKHLDAFGAALRRMEQADIAIEALARMDTKAASRAIDILNREQQRLLKEQDAAADALGAPYGA